MPARRAPKRAENRALRALVCPLSGSGVRKRTVRCRQKAERLEGCKVEGQEPKGRKAFPPAPPSAFPPCLPFRLPPCCLSCYWRSSRPSPSGSGRRGTSAGGRESRESALRRRRRAAGRTTSDSRASTPACACRAGWPTGFFIHSQNPVRLQALVRHAQIRRQVRGRLILRESRRARDTAGTSAGRTAPCRRASVVSTRSARSRASGTGRSCSRSTRSS